ncbi:MAG TPA: succinylglutamate desuccinylase/aspartoacylase family protein [Bradyrhizobium sp.]|nr:succinylglutamate desuccinylase/aspartoacylase family protein [Bradyrhizobium sp.]
MTEKTVDRRTVLMQGAAAIGASAALAANADLASAQAATAPGGTVYTGDMIDGKKVISQLNIDDLEPGKKELFFFRGVQTATGHRWHVSTMVAKGAKPGKRVVLVSGVHGDEISPIRTIQMVMDQLDPNEMSGSVLAVLDVSRPAMEGMQRRWPNSGRGIGLVDMNREWPGDENGPTASSRHAAMLFNKLMKPNADYAIDFHTSTTGVDLTAFNIARMDLPEVRAMAELFPIDQIFDNPAYPGILPNAFIDAGIPAFTPEIGASRILDHRMIPLFVEGTMNVLKHHGIVAGPIGRTGKDSGIFVGNSAYAVFASSGGFLEMLVKLNDRVEAGQKLAIQRNAFGEIVAEYTSDVSGEVMACRTDATSEPGNILVSVLYNRTPSDGVDPISE